MFMLHGWLDTSASFQFIIDAFTQERHVIAPDWRGCGLSEWVQGANGYRFIDLIADLDAILDRYTTDVPVDLVGHSLGANVACHYAGVRPARVRRVASLEGFGPLLRNGDEDPVNAPQRLAQWLDDLRGMRPFSRLSGEAEVIAELRRLNPRLDDAKTSFLLEHWFRQTDDGGYQRLGDPAYKVREPGRYRPAEVDAVWAAVRAPVLHVRAIDTALAVSPGAAEQMERFRDRLRAFLNFHEVTVGDSGHMVHHDQPEKVAGLIEEFLTSTR